MGAIAGLEVGLPRSIDEIDAAWLTRVLHTSGALDADASVASVASEPFAVGAGLLSLLYRLRPTYAGGSGPEVLIAKFPIDNAVQRGQADQLGFYPREIVFYRDLAPLSDLRTPTVHAAILAEDSTDFVVVMEDLSARGAADQRVGATWEQAIASVDAMAAFHASWHQSPMLPDLAHLFVPMLNPGYLHGLPQLFDNGWPHAKEHAADLLTSEVIAFGDRYGELIPFMLETANQPATLAHGDWRLDNLFFSDDGVIVIDFQISGQASGVFDLAYFMSQSLSREVRHGREDELIDRYIAALAARGVTRERDEVVHQLKVAVAQCLIYGVSSWAAYVDLPPRSQDLLRVLLGRSVQAIVDLDALAALPLD